MLVTVAVLGSAVRVEASVPGKPFTQTECEGHSDSVARLYTAGLGRATEQGGFDFWITEYTSGRWSLPEMAAFFVSSPEFSDTYGTLSQDGFIRQLYRNVLGREGEQGGVTYWNGQMSAGMTRATVLLRFSESPENIVTSGTSQPTLGVFNEGLPAAWRCGPDMSPALLSLSDFGSGWYEEPISRSSDRTACGQAFFFPAEAQRARFAQSDLGPGVSHAVYPHATQHGADTYMAQMRQAVINCPSYVDVNGWTVTYKALSFTEYGDESYAVRIVSTAPDGTWEFHSDLVVVRIGNVLSGVSFTDSFYVDVYETEQYVGTATDKVTAFRR